MSRSLRSSTARSGCFRRGVRPGVQTPVAPRIDQLVQLRAQPPRRYQHLTEQISRLDAHLDRLLADTAPDLIAKVGVGTHTAAALLVTAGDNPERLPHEGSFAHLTGSAPLDASSGKQQRHRLNRGGDRDANSALYQIALTRLSVDEDTKLYMKRRVAEGKTKKEAFRCLKPYIAREVHQCLVNNPALNPRLTHRSIPTVVTATRDGPAGCALVSVVASRNPSLFARTTL